MYRKMTNHLTQNIKVLIGISTVGLFLTYCFINIGSTKMRTIENVEKWFYLWDYVYEKQYNCTNEVYFGGKAGSFDIDGAYFLCLDKQHWPYSGTSGNKCLVYSFGIDWDFKFDDEIAKMGCEVHSFDPSMDLAEGTKRDSGVIFHRIGISEEDNDSGFKGWKMRTLKTLMKELGHEDRVLDYLKVDTDKPGGTGFEDVIMREMLDTGLRKCIRQYAMEIHLPNPFYNVQQWNRFDDVFRIIKTLQANGYRLYETVDNVRSWRYYHPGQNQMDIKRLQFEGSSRATVLWETHFVNTDIRGTCRKYLE